MGSSRKRGNATLKRNITHSSVVSGNSGRTWTCQAWRGDGVCTSYRYTLLPPPSCILSEVHCHACFSSTPRFFTTLSHSRFRCVLFLYVRFRGIPSHLIVSFSRFFLPPSESRTEALSRNEDLEYRRNRERFTVLKVRIR